MTNLPELPNINRARDFHLYDDKGNRYLDFYQDDGRAILGHRPHLLSTQLKNVLSKGLLGKMPSKYTYRLEKALLALLPDFPYIRIYEHYLKVERVLSESGLPSPRDIVRDLLFYEPDGDRAPGFWRPFVETEVTYPDIIVPVIPFPGGFAPGIVCSRVDFPGSFPSSDMCSPFLLAGLTRIVYDLLREIKERKREGWKSFEGSGWERKGPYLAPRHIREEAYFRLYREFLEQGILLNPVYGGICIIPGDFSPGEVAYFQRRS